eukprot:TRINITY_DN740_c0_g1_i3.p1 TRINITY_DN740_c0_g1~~TRINITY_DN740_c0_g1_i3.p1  ORF type:complete len:103 (-),score=47.65 TRINITY_DN740_c0_g1_i3:179-487(-)
MSRPLSKTRVYIASLPWRATRETLRSHFSQFGEVVFSSVAIDRATGRSRGFGVVEFRDADVATAVISQNHIIEGRTLRVSPAFERNFNSFKNEITEPHELDN